MPAVRAHDLLGVDATDHPLRFELPLKQSLLTPGKFLFGGAGLAAAIEAMEAATGRPLVWATAQYVSFARMPATLDLVVAVVASGHHVTQARCVVSNGGREILSATAALGHRPLPAAGQWAEPPTVPQPDDCPAGPRIESFKGTILDVMDIRLAAGRNYEELDGSPASGRSALWVRLPDGAGEVSAADLALVADNMPTGIGQALGRPAGGNSLDNTIRVCRLAPTEWVLVDIHVHAVSDGFGHGRAHLWSQDGVLLGTASQSVIVRFWDHRPGFT